MTGFDRGQADALDYWGALGRRHRLELSMVSPELVNVSLESKTGNRVVFFLDIGAVPC